MYARSQYTCVVTVRTYARLDIRTTYVYINEYRCLPSIQACTLS